MDPDQCYSKLICGPASVHDLFITGQQEICRGVINIERQKKAGVSVIGSILSKDNSTITVQVVTREKDFNMKMLT